MDKKKLFLWCLYDFANSVVFINFLVYFSKWLVVDGGIPDLAYNLVFVITAILLLFSAPALAAHTDVAGGRKRFLNLSTIGTIVSYGAAAGFGTMGMVWPAFIAFLFGQYFYQMSFMFYDPMINDISDEQHRARASGMGQFCNSAGMIAGLGMSLLLVDAGRLAPLWPALIIFTLLALPMMIFYKEDKVIPAQSVPAAKKKIKLGFDWRRFRQFIATSPAALILIAFFFYNDALVTITNNYSIYAGQVLNMTDSMTSIILIVVQVMAAIGAATIGFVGDKIGARRCLMGILWTWLVLIPVIAIANNIFLFFALAIMLGFSIGAGWAVSRAYISMNLDKGEVGYGFSFYTIFERFSSMIGPLVWGGIVGLGLGYRVAMLSMAVFIIAGIIILRFTKARIAR